MTISLKQLRSAHCHTRVHCGTCRTDADWRERVTGVRDFDCPHGMDAPRWRRWLRLPKPGDTARWLVTLTLVGPLFKRVLRWTGKQCKCEKRRRRWNELGWGGVVRVLLRRK